MNYYYDILVNMEDGMYEFYEWEKSDEIAPIKKIPFMRVSHEVFLDFLTKKILISQNLYEALYEKTTLKNTKDKWTCFLISDSKNCLFGEVNKKGEVTHKSKLLVEDENNVNELASTLKFEEITYEIIGEENVNRELRRTFNEKKRIKAELKELEITKNVDKCFYLYYEWFYETNDDFAQCLQKMNELVDKTDAKIIHHLAHLIELSYKEQL